MSQRRLSSLDRLLIGIDAGLRALAGQAPAPSQASPAETVPDVVLSESARRRVEALVRVNHAGEVAAQALYCGQALVARDAKFRQQLEAAATEEEDHLAWCRARLDEIGGRPSYLVPGWYLGAFAIGAAAGCAGDRVSRGFLAETERQVVEHLERHLVALPPEDARTRAVLMQMRDDEGRHAATAESGGATPLPSLLKLAMRLGSKVMTHGAYWI